MMFITKTRKNENLHEVSVQDKNAMDLSCFQYFVFS